MSPRRISLLFAPLTLPCIVLVGWLSVSELSGAVQDTDLEDKPLVIELRDKIELAEVQLEIRQQMVRVAQAEATADPAEIRKTKSLLKEAQVNLEWCVHEAKRTEELFKRGVSSPSERSRANADVSEAESRIQVLEATLESQTKPSRVHEEQIRLLELKAKKAKIKLDQLRRSLNRFLSSAAEPLPLQ